MSTTSPDMALPRCVICSTAFIKRNGMQKTCCAEHSRIYKPIALKQARAKMNARYHADPEFRAHRIKNAMDWQRRKLKEDPEYACRSMARAKLRNTAAMALIKELGLEHKLKEIVG